MRILDTTPITGTAGFPIKSGTLVHIQDAYAEALNALGQAIVGSAYYSPTTIYRLYGVEISVVSLTYIITAGAVFYNGEVFLVNAQNINILAGHTLASGITTTFFTDPIADPTTFTDDTQHNVHQIRNITFAESTSGAGLGLPVDIHNSWSNTGLTFLNSASDYGGSSGYYPVSYLQEGNKVFFSGIIQIPLSSTIGQINVLQLPASIIPASNCFLYPPTQGASTNPFVNITTAGFLSIEIASTTTDTATIYLDGITYRLK